MIRTPLPALLAAVALALAGCQTPVGDDDDDGANSCDEEPRAAPYVAGIERVGEEGLVRVAILSANPAPPDVGENDWVLQVSDAETGAMLTGCALTVTGWMPDHGHGTVYDPTITETATEGSYDVVSLDLIMAGYWEITFTVECPPLDADSAMFPFCLLG